VSLHLLWTSADSLVVAFALAFIVPRRHVLPLILMFGVCDALGSALGVGVPVAGGGLGLRPAAAACDGQFRVARAGPYRPRGAVQRRDGWPRIFVRSHGALFVERKS
jgi:hypothetical protein